MKRKLKLFVWPAFNPDWSDGLAFAIAYDETEARKIILKKRGLGVCEWGDVFIHRLDRKIAYFVSGGG